MKCYGHPYARTPNLDKLASEGTRFTQFYMTGITCCPSRTGLMTGKFPATFREYPAGAGFGKQVTITELLKKQGYATGHFGKWHIGPKQSPGTYGIDSINVTDGGRADGKRQDERGRDASIFDDAIAFIEKNKQGPVLRQRVGAHQPLPDQPAPGVGRQVQGPDREGNGLLSLHAGRSSPTVRKSGGDVNVSMRRYLADVQSMDECVGRLLKTLDDLGLRDNTIVVFSSDQGPAPGPAAEESGSPAARQEDRSGSNNNANMLGYAGELRGGKHGMYEGGVRVPFIIRWPGHVPANQVNTASVIGGIDWLPTLCGITGAKIDASDVRRRGRFQRLAWQGPRAHQAAVLEDQRRPQRYRHPRRPTGSCSTRSATGARPSCTTCRSTRARARMSRRSTPKSSRHLTAKVEKWKATLPKDYVKTSDPD